MRPSRGGGQCFDAADAIDTEPPGGLEFEGLFIISLSTTTSLESDGFRVNPRPLLLTRDSTGKIFTGSGKFKCDASFQIVGFQTSVLLFFIQRIQIVMIRMIRMEEGVGLMFGMAQCDDRGRHTGPYRTSVQPLPPYVSSGS